MANYTGKIIMQTFEEMLDEMPFGKITVSALVKRCEISSNTFYYHYKDIYDLLEAWLDRRAKEYQKQIACETELATNFKIILRGIKEHSKRVYHISDSVSRDRLERYVFTNVEQLFYSDLRRRTANVQVDEATFEQISRVYCYAVLGFFIKYLWNDMKADIDSSVDELWNIFEGMLSSALQDIDHNHPQTPEE